MNLSWIPNSLSMGNLFLGFVAINFSVMASAYKDKNYFLYATICILIAAVFDILDGRIARKINHPNPLGKELDSLADLVTFGLSPGVMFYVMMYGEQSLYHTPIHPVVGMFIAFLFPLFAALRLAKFNITEPKNFFTGIPSPIAGCSTVIILNFDKIPDPLTFIPFLHEFTLSIPWWGANAIFIFYAVLMVTKFQFAKYPAILTRMANGTMLVKNLFAIALIISVVFLFKFLLIISTIVYTFKPIIFFKKKLADT